MPKVSVIVPNYNHAQFLPQRIDTILCQTLQDFEVILLDDCSTDQSRSILSQYAGDPRIQIEFNDVNSGSTFRQWNKGVRLARGKYVWIAESDDYSDPRFLERLVPILEAEPDVVFVYCRSHRVMQDGVPDGFADFYLTALDAHVWSADFRADGCEECRNYFVQLNLVPNASSVIFRKGVYEQVGGADENMRFCGDWKLWAAIALCGKIAYVSEPLNYFRVHESTVRNQAVRARVDVLEYLQVSRWILDRVRVTDAILEKTCNRRAALWVPVLVSLHGSAALKRRVLRHVLALDPHPFRRMLGPVMTIVRLKIRRHWRALQSS
jgi:glycosyltransferase involved in cell wall biosynthesis